jgi:hypothetical protein
VLMRRMRTEVVFQGVNMNARVNGCAMLWVFTMICLVASTCALAKEPQDRDPDKPKEPPDQRMLGSLREYMDVSDAEWKVLLPYITKVQHLTGELREVRDGSKEYNPAKPFKSPKERFDGGPGADQPPGAPSPSSVAVAEVNEKARELRAIMEDKSARPEDIRTKLRAYRVARAEAQKQVAKELAEARAKLTELLSVRQELVCVVSGLLE